MKRFTSGICATFAAASCASLAWGIGAGTALAPEPARLTVDLSGPTGSTAAAIYVQQQPSQVLIWPGGYTASADPPVVGTPCSTVQLPYGVTSTKRIQGVGTYRRCFDWDYLAPPPPEAIRPLPPDATGSGTSANPETELTVTAIASTSASVVKWPVDWTFGSKKMKAGTPCSDFDLYAGESTYKHIQLMSAKSAYSRCVSISEPAILP